MTLPQYGQPIARVELTSAMVLAALGVAGIVSSVTGTANQITAAPTTGAVVVSLPTSGTLPGVWHAASGFVVDAGGLTVTAGGATITAGNVTLTAGNLVFGAASAKIIPGATSLLIRNAADSASNIDITDAGIATIRAGLVVTSGSIGFGSATNIGVQIQQAGSFASAGSIGSLYNIGATLSGDAGSELDALRIAPTFVEAASGNHSLLASININVATVTGGVGTVTNTASLYIAGAMGATVSGANYAIWVDAGPVRLDDPTLILGGISYTVPPDDGDAGEQLQTNGSGVLTWEAAVSSRQYKIVGEQGSAKDALNLMLNTAVYKFRYNPEFKKGTGDYATEYMGVMADDAPWAMHHNGGILNPVNALGYTVLGFQAVNEKIAGLEKELAELKAR